MFNPKILHFNIGGAQVYLAEMDDGVEVEPVMPVIRQRLIEQTADPQLKRQRYCVWRLLDYALKQTIGNGVDGLSFTVDGNGRWSCNGGVCFSLSHSKGAVAVAVSNQPVGIDVEAVDEQRFNARLAERILTQREQTLYNSVPQQQQSQMLAAAWAKKESIFKRDGGKVFVANNIDTAESQSQCKEVRLGNVTYVVAVAY